MVENLLKFVLFLRCEWYK